MRESTPDYINSVDCPFKFFFYEKTIYYGLAIVSFTAVLAILISVRQLVIDGAKDTKKSIIILIGGILIGIIVGFTTCLPLFL